MKTNPKAPWQAGFALIVTLTLMILLTVIAVGLLTLSSVSLRSVGQSSAASIARTNARLAMILALGDLQVSLGRDTSVSAPASSVMENAERPHLTGVWQQPSGSSGSDANSWHWAPTPGGSADYSAKKGLFKGWLTSSPILADAAEFEFAKSGIDAGEDVVTLVGDPKNELKNNNVSILVTANKVKVGRPNQRGKFAWTVFDESTKASIQLGDPANTLTAGQEIASRAVSSRVRADILTDKLEPALRTPRNLISLNTAVIPGGPATSEEFAKRFHDFTTNSVGLLTDTARGGLRSDLTPLLESGTGTALPEGLFFDADGKTAAATPYPADFALSAPRWAYLRDHYRKYKGITQADGELAYKLPAPGVGDLEINRDGIKPAPTTERLIPIIAKMQLVFSVVTHHAHIGGRKNYYDMHGVPKGNSQYAIPHLVYDPVITLYNPYDVSLDLTKLRIRVWDPPVVFRFSKVVGGVETFYRPGGGWTGLAQLSHKDENITTARKAFTLILTDGTNAKSGTRLKLQPGEVRVFSPRVQDAWNWGAETANEWEPKTFFDWGVHLRNFSNSDPRTPAPGIGQYGVETVPGWNFKAGLQTDHLANGTRDPATLYDFEKSTPAPPGRDIGGFVMTKLEDSVRVEAKPFVAKGNASKSFQIDILAGFKVGRVGYSDSQSDSGNSGVLEDTLRSYSFNFANATDASAELSENPSSPIVSQKFNAGSLLQRTSEILTGTGVEGPGGKRVFAMLEMSCRTTKDALTDNKPWLYNNPVVEGGVQTSSVVGLANQSYDLRFMEMTSTNGFPKGIDIDGTSYRGYLGATGSANRGSSFVHMMHIPTAPAPSLGDLIHSNLISSSNLPRVVHPFGNSRAHPLIPTKTISKDLSGAAPLVDHSYLLNDALWDKYYFSSLADYTAGQGAMDKSYTREQVMKGVLDGTQPALNRRLVPVAAPGDAAALSKDLNAMAPLELSRQTGKYLGITGPFNLSSTSVDAWRAVLSSIRDRAVYGATVNTVGTASTGTTTTLKSTSFSNNEITPFVRSGRPLADSTSRDSMRWAGFRALTDDQITKLAKSIIKEITRRGVEDKAPVFSIGEFVNRRLGTAGGLHTLAGIIQTAIDNEGEINGQSDDDSKTLAVAYVNTARKTGVETQEVMNGKSAEGAPSMLTQGDILSALAPIVTVRGDTFKIRCYGEADAADGKTVLARAWCEVVVQRMPEFVDSKDAPETRINDLASAANKKFGRRFEVVSFRWLSENEI